MVVGMRFLIGIIIFLLVIMLISAVIAASDTVSGVFR